MENVRLSPEERRQRVKRAQEWVEQYGGGGEGGLGHGIIFIRFEDTW
jgi:hypothetical protein